MKFQIKVITMVESTAGINLEPEIAEIDSKLGGFQGLFPTFRSGFKCQK